MKLFNTPTPQLAIAFALLMFSFSSCKKEGTGGKATLVAFIKHHQTAIKGATVYVKFGATEFPGKNPSDYDLAVKGESDEDHVHIKELQWGDYYLYAEGYDSAEIVTGGTPATIKRSEKNEEKDVNIAASEE